MERIGVTDVETSEDRGDEVDVEEIMRRIRENIRRRREAGLDPEKMDQTPGDVSCCAEDLQRDLDYINSNWDIENNSYYISSHRCITGKFLVTGRELVHGEVRRYVDPVIVKQKEFNGSTVRILNEITRKIDEITQKTTELDERIGVVKAEIGEDVANRIDEARNEIEGKIALKTTELDAWLGVVKAEIGEDVANRIDETRNEIEGKIALKTTELDERIGVVTAEIGEDVANRIDETRNEIEGKIAQKTTELDERIGLVTAEIGGEVEDRVRAVVAMMNEDIENKVWLANILEGRVGSGYKNQEIASPAINSEEMNYFVFEERFRGSQEDIKERQAVFLHYFEGCMNVLDIGCGRGEFLGLLREHGIGVCGVDIDEDMVNFCRSKGLSVEKKDAVTYLEKLDDKSLDGIFIDQVVEHLEPDYLVKMLGLCYKKLKYGYYIVIETVNPLSLVSLANFYIDMTHKKPVHPETLKFLLGSVGFREIETRFFSPVRDEARLKRIPLRDEIDAREKSSAEVYNQNVEMLNSILYGAQDYAVIGKK